jgi:hypothetical protein
MAWLRRPLLPGSSRVDCVLVHRLPPDAAEKVVNCHLFGPAPVVGWVQAAVCAASGAATLPPGQPVATCNKPIS